MRNTLTIEEKDNNYIIKDISLNLIQIFDLNNSDYYDIINSDLAIPFLIKYVNLLKSSTVNYIEFLHSINRDVFKIQITKGIDKQYTIFFENTHLRIEKPKVDLDIVENSYEIISNDKDLLDVIDLKNKNPQAVQLEAIYLLKKIQEELKELKEKDKEQEKKFIEKEELNLTYFINQLGIKNLIIFIFLVSIIESFILEPLISPYVDKLYDQFDNSIFENQSIN